MTIRSLSSAFPIIERNSSNPRGSQLAAFMIAT
jgi:hypothetical protein